MFFFFKQKTAYEMRISDWSSDVCSSDLLPALKADEIGVGQARFEPFARRSLADHDHLVRHAAPPKHVDGVGQDVEPLLHHEPAEKGERGHLVVDPQRAAPRHVETTRVDTPLAEPHRPKARSAGYHVCAKSRRATFQQ